MSDGDEDWFEAAVRARDGEDEDDADAEASVDEPTTATGSDESAGDRADAAPEGVDDAPDEAEGEPLFESDFGTALEDVEVPALEEGAGTDGFDDLAFGFDGPGESDFDDDLESALPRIDLGIDGLDRMIQGGVPERSLMVAIGGAGTGKTTFGLQFLHHGLEEGERAVFLTLEETRQRVIDSATEKGIPFDEHVAEDRLAIVDVDPVEMANSLASIRSELPRLIESFGASRLVLDSVSLLEMMYDDRATRRNEIFDFTRSLKEAGVTALLTSEASEESRYASRFGIVEYLTDAVFVMRYVRPDDFRETRMAIEIQKIRDANHSRETKPYEITGEGISVHQQANLF